jgi:hypothetical protein
MQLSRAIARWGAALVCAVSLWLASSPARACGNATLEDDEAYTKMREAERALAEGDVLGAREGAAAAVRLDERLTPRGVWLWSMSFVRDRDATAGEIANAVRRMAEVRSPDEDPRFDAGYGEALARAGRDDEAFALLDPLARRDLLGDPYAFGALSRVSRARGDEARATWALQRCQVIATRAQACELVYPPRPLLRGSPIAFGGLGAVVLAFVGARRRRRTRSPAPWVGHADRARAALTLSAGVMLALSVVSPVVGVALVAASLVVGSWLERRLFLRAARRGAVAGHVVRSAEAGDASLAELRLFCGPAPGETLERVVDPSYREAARDPILRVGRRSSAPLVAMLFAAVVLALGASTLLVLARSSAAPEPIPLSL